MVLTGKRGGYGAMRPMLRLIRDDPDLELEIVATDMHLKTEFGFTIDEINEEFDGLVGEIYVKGRTKGNELGEILTRLSDIMSADRPDVLVLMGDRGETLAAAIAATQFNIPIAHIQGGDITGGIDNPQRNAISKLAHVHFTSCRQSTEWLLRMNERHCRIHEVGDLHVDPIVAGGIEEPSWVSELTKPVVIVLQHPDTLSPDTSYNEMNKTLEAVSSNGLSPVVIYPCSDQGYKGTIKSIKWWCGSGTGRIGNHCVVTKNLKSPEFLGLMSTVSVIVGNSSAGIIEAPYFGLRAVDIGYRQYGRLSCDLTKWVPHDSDLIAQAIRESIDAGSGKVNNTLYGDGHAGERVVKVLKELEINDKLLRK